MKKIVLLIVLAGLAFWYFDYSHRMTEASITEAYQEQERALNAMNTEYLCGRLDDDYQETSVVHGGSHAGPLVMDKTQACTEVKQMALVMQRIGIVPGSMISPHYNIEIKHIELSANRKSATVEMVATMKLGDMLLMRGRSTDQVIRRAGRIYALASDSEVWQYGRR